MTEETKPTQPKPLSPQQRIIMQHLADGLTQKEIGRAMGIKLDTIKKYLKKIRKKYGCASTLQCMAVLVSCGEIVVEPLTISKNVL